MDQMVDHPVLAVILVAWVGFCVYKAVAQALAETTEQRHRHPTYPALDEGDMLQQAELDRLTRVDKQVDRRLDNQGYLLWGIAAINGLAAIIEIWGFFK